jgi:hypothetical protein
MPISSMNDLADREANGRLDELGDNDLPTLLALIALELHEIRKALTRP